MSTPIGDVRSLIAALDAQDDQATAEIKAIFRKRELDNIDTFGDYVAELTEEIARAKQELGIAIKSNHARQAFWMSCALVGVTYALRTAMQVAVDVAEGKE